jgi:hypothetical protein
MSKKISNELYNDLKNVIDDASELFTSKEQFAYYTGLQGNSLTDLMNSLKHVQEWVYWQD